MTMLKPELVKKIKSCFDLNIYETKVWLALLSKGVSSAGEIAEMSGVPRSRTYDVLESLEKRGFAIEKLGKPVKYIAVKPEVVVDKLKINTLRNADDKVKTLAKLKDTPEYLELETLHKTGIIPVKRSDISGAVKGKTNIYSHIKEMLENSEKEAIICMSASELESKSRIFSDIIDRLRKSGVKLKTALSGTEQEVKRVESRFRIKSEKIDFKSKFFISDRKQVLFVINNTSNSEEEEVGIWIDSEFFANSLAYLFDMATKS